MESGEFTPSTQQILHWQTRTGRPFDAREDEALPVVTCPRCGDEREVPWTEASVPQNGGNGFAEFGFNCECASCNFVISRDSMATKKFVDDLIIAQGLQERFMAYVLVHLSLNAIMLIVLK